VAGKGANSKTCRKDWIFYRQVENAEKIDDPVSAFGCTFVRN
jgi:hypothetical protein